MKQTLLILTAISSLLFISCAGEIDNQAQFFSNYDEFCGQAFSGVTNYVDLGSGELFEDAELTMIVRDCEEDVVRIPFHVDEDTSRTWIVRMSPQGLHLSHDHRYEDGSQHDNNFYGGYADDEGTAFVQYFPADHRTIEDRPARAINRWGIEFDLDNMSYFYRLYLDGEMRLEAEFDLSDPQEI